MSEGAADVDGADDEGDAGDQAGMHELGVLDPIRAHVTRHTGRHEPDYTIGAFWMFVLNASCIKPDNCNDNGDNERLDGALLHEADQRANDEEGRVGLDERGNGHLLDNRNRTQKWDESH